MPKKNLNLKDLKVLSFITNDKTSEIRGGDTCNNNGIGCQPCYSSCADALNMAAL